MGEQHSAPTGDIETYWNITPSSPTTHYTKIDESWANPDTSDYIHETIDYQLDGYTFPADGPASMVTVHTIYVDFYLNTTNVTTIPGFVISLYLAGVYLTQQTFKCDTGGAWQKKRFPFTGLSISKAQYNTLQVKIMCLPGNPGWPNPIDLE